jgi:23S rRNA (cytosine1962-C5)-methyltransferase
MHGASALRTFESKWFGDDVSRGFVSDKMELMWNASEYQLLDFGKGRKLERFGGIVLDRPAPAAAGVLPRLSREWRLADVQLDEDGKELAGKLKLEKWQVYFHNLVFNLKLTPFGHVGLFPEQAANWCWLSSVASEMLGKLARPPQALNLFAYTGGATLMLASAGMSVTHVDASSPAVKWARCNALDSGLAGSSIRWIVEDARKFVARELRRGKQYDMVILDPPSYGHGPDGKRWSIERDLEPLLVECLALLRNRPVALLLTGHSETIDQRICSRWLEQYGPKFRVKVGRLLLEQGLQRGLDAGFYLRAFCGIDTGKVE